MVEGGRLTAKKARVADILAGNLDEANAPRVNVMGVVVSIDKSEPPSFVLDDRTELVVVRQFDRQPTPLIGSIVTVIGRVREYGGERYITSEIARALDSKWLEVRERELLKQSSFVTPAMPSPGQHVEVEEEVVDDVPDGNIELLALLRKLDTGSGVLVDDIIAQAGPDAEKTVGLLLQRGDVFEVSPGRLKILE